MPTYGQRRLARALYGTKPRSAAFVVGTGPSIADAELLLQNSPPNSFRIALNSAITRIPSEYWFFIDGDAYLRDRAHPNAKAAIAVGSDRFWPIYGKEVYVWERAFHKSDIECGKLVHRNTSLIAAMHFAAWLGAHNIFLVGCNNTVDPNKVYTQEQLEIQNNTYARVYNSLLVDMFHWAPPWLTAWDCSGGWLPLPKLALKDAIEAINAVSKAV